jgi:SAM-dependent methyltransferase
VFNPGERDTIGRFSELANLYDNHRPDYPPAAVDSVMNFANLQPGMRLVDVGCGTGISSRQFAQRALEVIGIEPNIQMRQFAEALGGPVTYREGRADATGLPNSFVDAVLAAQSFHWFPNEPALREFSRILKPGGCVALLWNDRDDADQFTAGYSALMRIHSPDRELSELRQSETGEELLRSAHFEQAARFEFPHHQFLTIEQFVGRAYSVSFAPREEHAKRQFESDLHFLHGRFADDGTVAMRYRTVLYVARKPLVPS